MKEKEKKLFNYSDENIKESEYSAGDKSSPMASAGKTDVDYTTENLKKETGQPGGEENAAGKNSNQETPETRIGSKPLPDEKLNKGE